LNPASGRTLFGLARRLDAQGRAADAAIVKREFDEAWKQPTSPLSVDALF
jgi:hypothetical protein